MHTIPSANPRSTVIESTLTEFQMMKEALLEHGVQARLISSSDDRCTWQMQNPYEVWANLYCNRNSATANDVCCAAKSEIESGAWCR